MTTDNYDAGTALDAYYPTRDERRTARLWSIEKLIHDMAEIGMIEFFEGAGTDPTVLTGYDSTKIWLQVASGVTDEPGTIRVYDGVGTESLVASWPVMDATKFKTYLSGVGSSLGFDPKSIVFVSSLGSFTEDNTNFQYDSVTHKMTVAGITVGTNDTSNTLYGRNAGASLVTPASSHNGDGNTLIGSGAGAAMTTAFATTIVGGSSGSALTIGDSNTIVGFQNGGALTSGKWNTLIGVDCILTDTDCANNVVIGHHTGSNIAFSADQGECVVIGAEALKVGVGGISAVIVGYRAAYNSNASAVSNTLVGHLSGFTNTSGSLLTAIGKETLFSNTTGIENSAIGYRTLYNNTDGDNNCAYGNYAGFTNTTGNSSVFFGNNAGFYETGGNKLFIDNAARANESDGRAKSLIYGVFGTGPSDQTLQINGKLIAYGTPTNDSAAVGQIGERQIATLDYVSRITLTSATAANIGFVDLTAGDWEVSGIVYTDTGATTVVSYTIASLSATSATLDQTVGKFSSFSGSNQSPAFPPYQISIASTTRFYLVVQSAFTTSTQKAYGRISAIRVR